MTNIIRLFILLVSVIAIPACIQKKNTSQIPNENIKEPISLSTIITNEAPTENRKTPVEISVNQIEWVLSNNEKITASPKSILWEATFDNEGIVTMTVPKTTKPWYNIILCKKEKNQWIIGGLIDFPISPDRKNHINELALPIKNYTISKTKMLDKEIFAFANEKKVIVICKYPCPSSSLPKDFKSEEIQSITDIKSENNYSTLRRIDRKNIVWIAGNISEPEIIKILNSLPSSTSLNFPYKSA